MLLGRGGSRVGEAAEQGSKEGLGARPGAMPGAAHGLGAPADATVLMALAKEAPEPRELMGGQVGAARGPTASILA